MISYIILASSVSIDALGIGISYGIRNSYINLKSKIIIATITFFMCLIGFLIGNILSLFLEDFALKIIGSLILLFLGLYIIIKEIKKLKYMKRKAEIVNDNRESIGIGEVLYLAMAISMDAMTAGISASLLGIRSIVFPILVMLCHMIFLSSGMKLGKNVKGISKLPQNIWSIISGILLILISFDNSIT